MATAPLLSTYQANAPGQVESRFDYTAVFHRLKRCCNYCKNAIGLKLVSWIVELLNEQVWDPRNEILIAMAHVKEVN